MDRHSSSTKKADRNAGHASTPHTRYTKNNSPFGVVCDKAFATHYASTPHTRYTKNNYPFSFPCGVRMPRRNALFSLLRSAWCAAQRTILPSPLSVPRGVRMP